MSKKLELSIVVPCLNEAGNIPNLVERVINVFRERNLNGELIIVDDGSTDTTPSLVKSLQATHSQLRYLRHETNGGIEKAWRTGLNSAKGTYTCFIDGDLQNLPEDIWRLYREAEFTHADLIQGHRNHIGRLKDSRYILSRGLNFALNTLFRTHLRDCKSGFVLAPTPILQDILDHRFQYRFFQTFIAVAARSKGYRVHEVETLFESRLAGKSFLPRFPLAVVMWSLVDLAKGLVEYRGSPRKVDLVEDAIARSSRNLPSTQRSLRSRFLLRLYFATMPLHAWMITSRARRYFNYLNLSQWLSPDEIKSLQMLKLRALLVHAHRHVPYYRELFEKNRIEPESIRTHEDLARLPFLTKDSVRKNLYFGLLSDNHEKKNILRIKTSGSTGEPFVLWADKHQLEIRWAATLRSLEWTGYRFGDRTLRLWHQTMGMTFIQIFRERLDALLSRRAFIPAFELSAENLQKFAKRIARIKPALMDGYAESLNFLARYLKENPIQGVNPQAVVSSAQTLPDDTREKLEAAFGCQVFDKYGSREFSGIAYECEAHRGHHVVGESYIVEIIKDGRPALPGEMGEVVVTDLNNYCLPLIRYRIGDLAIAMDNKETCACGRGLPRVGRIEGRVQSLIVGSNGAYLPGTFFSHLFKDFDHVVRQFQVLQTEPGAVTLKLIRGDRYDETEFSNLLALLKKYLGEKTPITIEWHDVIPLGNNGKHQASISKVGLDFQKLRKAG